MFYLGLCIGLLPLFTSLSDANSFDPASAYRHTQNTFVHGYLRRAQDEADRGYWQSVDRAPEWSRKFQILEATAMVWRGSDEDLLLLFKRPSTIVGASQAADDNADVEQYALETTALVHLGRLSEAQQRLDAANKFCLAKDMLACGAVLRARGLLYLSHGELDQAKNAYLQALAFARAHGDRLLEGTVLLNLASTVSQQEHHDEALDLYKQSYRLAMGLGAEDLAQTALSNQGWELYNFGNIEKALELYTEAGRRASLLGDTDGLAQSYIVIALVYVDLGELKLAETTDLQAIELAKTIERIDKIVNASEDLAQVYIDEQKPDDADRYSGQALTLSQQAGNQPDILYCHMLQGEAAALRHDWPLADSLLHEVILAPESQRRMRWNAEHTLATSYEAQGQTVAAEQAYKAAIAFVEAARGDLHQELSQLSFLTNAARIYDDYIHFLVAQGRSGEALEAADWSRARTLQQGLGLISASASIKPPQMHASQIARATNTTLLFYWLGEKQSYLWAVTPEKTTLVALPAKSEIVTKMQRYRRTLLALKDPLRTNGGQADKDGRELYDMLVAPVASIADASRPVVLFTDGEMTQLNFETLLVGSPTPHYWIEDATVSAAPSIRLFATNNKTVTAMQDNLLLLGDAVSADSAYPALPMAAVEVKKVRDNFPSADELIFSGAHASPRTYLASKPEQFSYIHFVAHATASATDPLESAVILSRDGGAGDDSYKLYAREILKHPISARLVTISSCNSSGTKSYAGEGVVGLSWAFLRAGAHNTIAALWEVSDASTPDLMDHLYAGLVQSHPPATALRDAKLSLLHSNSGFSRPFYWAPFQLYSGR